MPKLKTRKAAAKRFEATGSGKKIKRRKAFKNHLHERDEKEVRLMLPYL